MNLLIRDDITVVKTRTTESRVSVSCTVKVNTSPTSISISSSETIYEKKTKTSKVTLTPQDSNDELRWKSSKKLVATVSANGFFEEIQRDSMS